MTPRIDYLKSKVKEYYKRKPPVAPPDFEKREFGFGDQKKIDYRHIAFKTEKEFQEFFVERAPMYASYSVGYYEFPDGRPMKNKKMQGSDMIFEFDAECEHDTLACPECLEWTKQQTFKLVEDFLIPDFGFDKKDVIISFSGNRGYHIHLRTKTVYDLDKKARRDIVDYIKLNNIQLPMFFQNANLKSTGWKGKLTTHLHDLIKNADETSLKKYKFMPKTIQRILGRKQEILSGIEQGNFDQLRGAQKIWNKIAEKHLKETALDLDASVTLDIVRLIRTPSTIHSSTGFLDMYVDNLETFDPFKTAVAFLNYPEKIKFKKDVTEFVLSDTTFGPYKKDQEVEIPEFAAVFCIGKDVAEHI